MLTGEPKAQLDRIWDDFWSGGITNPLSVIEQITYLLFIKRLDEVQNLIDKKNQKLAIPQKDIFNPDQQMFRWKNFKDKEPQEMFDLMVNSIFPFIKNLYSDPSQPNTHDNDFAKYMKDAVFLIPNGRLLSNVVAKLSGLNMESRDLKGDVYEYLLSKLSTSGQNGQFRTPRHIIAMIVEIVKPLPEDIVADPASGTSGFLISAINYLINTYTIIFTDETLRKHFMNTMFFGNDFDVTMSRIGAMNLVLHGIENPNLSGIDALSDSFITERDTYTLILANPPFKGALEFSTVAKDLLKLCHTRKTELLFLALFIRMLRTGGRCACIVPDGVLFGSSAAHQAIRKEIIDNQRLIAVISMPSGVFKPYAGVSTAVLYFHKTQSGGTDRVWFYDMKADGFSLDDKRTQLAEDVHENNNIPDILARVSHLEAEALRKRTDQSFMVDVEEIRSNGYDLSINRYKETVHEEVVYDSPARIIADLKKMEDEIQSGLNELEGLIINEF